MKRVVVVDDEPSVGAAVRDLLEPEGYAVDAPLDPEAALPELIRSAPDLVILDVNMPGMSGWELCSLLRRQSATRTVPVLFLTGRQEVRDRITAMQVGGSDYLAKPFGADELRRKVRSLLKDREKTEER
ncbi:MAG TPA: response regulator transcription factor [Thermoanaerobaculia bacterium]|nr:response regulator transcription factor [Thermoanaerobaculia bacterium]